MSDRQADRMRQDSDRTVLSVPEAAERLGVTPDAIRARLHRGTLEGEKQSGQWRIFLPNEPADVLLSDSKTPAEPTGNQQDATGTRQDAGRQDYAERYAQLERENQRLWTELEARTEENRRRDHIIAGLVERLPAIPAGDQETRPPDAVVTQPPAPGQEKHIVVGDGTRRGPIRRS